MSLNDNELNLDDAINDIAWSNNYPHRRSEEIVSFLHKRKDLTVMASFIQNGLKNRINPFGISDIVSKTDRFGDYQKTIRAILENKMKREDIEKLHLSQKIDIQTLEDQSAFISHILDKAQSIYRQLGQPIPAEIDLDKPKNGANLQYLTQLFSLICIGFKQPWER
jgi:hypothetical protein